MTCQLRGGSSELPLCDMPVKGGSSELSLCDVPVKDNNMKKILKSNIKIVERDKIDNLTQKYMNDHFSGLI